jgi:hypothetical protein
MKKNKRLEAHRQKKTALVIILLTVFLIIFSVQDISAFKFSEIDNVKYYNEGEKEIILRDSILWIFPTDNIIKATLDSPLNFKVGEGYQKVAQFTINPDQDYEEVLGSFEFYDLKNKGKKISKQIDVKYLATEQIEVNDYKEICSPSLNGSKVEDCIKIKTGSHFEDKEVWKDFDNSLKINKEVVIGLFTNVEIGDKVEWVPRIAGVKINEWATWEGSLNTDLFFYYSFNQDTGNLIVNNSVDGTFMNLTIVSNATFVLGKEGNAILPNKSTIAQPGWDVGNVSGFSLNFWVNQSGDIGNVADTGVVLQNGNGNGNGEFFVGYEYSNNNFFKPTAYSCVLPSGSYLNNSNWQMISVTYNSTDLYLYINGSLFSRVTCPFIFDGGDYPLSFFLAPGPIGLANISIDAMAGWNRTITSSEVSILWDSGSGTFFKGGGKSPPITLNSPINGYNSTNSTIDFNCSSEDDVLIENVTLWIDGIINYTIIDGIDNSTELFKTLDFPDGSYNWTCTSRDNENNEGTTGTRLFNITTIPAISFQSPTPDNNLNLSTSSFMINVSLTETYFKNLTFFLYNSSGLYSSIIYTDSTRAYNFTSLPSEIYNYSAEVWTTTNQKNSTETRFIILDTENPVINITFPINISYKKFKDNLTIQWTISDLYLQNCLGSFDGGINNFSLICLDNNYSSIITSPINNSFMIWANDSFGNSAFFKRNWNYSIFEWNQTFITTTLEGNTEQFSINISYDNFKFSNIQGILVYNYTRYTGIKYIYGENLIFNKTLPIPETNVQINNSFYWEFVLDSTYINSSFNNQTINPINLDNCSAYSTSLYNYTMFDEETKIKLSNTTIKFSLDLWDSSRTIKIATLNNSYKNINPVRICLDNSLGKNINFSADSIIQYTANHSINENTTNIYATEYYNILRQEITNSTIPINTNLYGLLLEDSTEFQLTFRNSDYALAPNIIVYLYRQYIEDNDFKVVEAPLTDSNGQTILHMVRNNVVYNLLMADKTGKVIATFNKVIAFCQDYTIGNCIIILNAKTGGDSLYDYTDDLGISYTTPTYSNYTNLISFDFVSNDLSSKTVMTEVIKNSPFGNRSICTDTLTSSSGTITCDVSDIIETDRFLFINIYVDGDLKVHSGIDLESEDTGSFGLVNGAFIAFLLILFLICMFMEDKSALVFSIIIGWAIVCGLGLINGTIIWAVSGGIWLLVTAIIFLWKLKKEEIG